MILCKEFAEKLRELGYDTIIGVPDSTFKGLISYFYSSNIFNHLVATNECEAIGIAAGYYLSHKRPALIYLQNSGFSKTINPYTSLLVKEICSIPVLMLIGWRGEPGLNDALQHIIDGKIMLKLFKVLQLKYVILKDYRWEYQLRRAHNFIVTNEVPYAIVIRKGLFEEMEVHMPENDYLISRETAIRTIAECVSDKCVFISTTGKISRELFEIREMRRETHGKDFYTIGAMGCASSIGFGVGLKSSDRKIFILDGDGSTLMQLGTLATIGHYKNHNIKHIIIDNNAHESTGGQPTVSNSVNFPEIAKACGYEFVATVNDEKELRRLVKDIEHNNRLSLLVIKTKMGSRKDLGRPTLTPRENKDAFTRNF